MLLGSILIANRQLLFISKNQYCRLERDLLQRLLEETFNSEYSSFNYQPFKVLLIGTDCATNLALAIIIKFEFLQSSAMMMN